ncbi:MAG: hypothetical protein H6807_17770 [Planctomycetes bacterium]|nr:hypothetical protein [Planctomycetota bacterium]
MSEDTVDHADEADQGGARTILHGFLVGVLCEILGAGITMLCEPTAIFFVGGLQFIWMVPGFLVLVAMGAAPGIKKGFILCAGLLVLLSALCFGGFMVLARLNGGFGG